MHFSSLSSQTSHSPLQSRIHSLRHNTYFVACYLLALRKKMPIDQSLCYFFLISERMRHTFEWMAGGRRTFLNNLYILCPHIYNYSNDTVMKRLSILLILNDTHQLSYLIGFCNKANLGADACIVGKKEHSSIVNGM